MLQHEFEERVGMKVSATEYDAIEVVYMNADESIDKDEFCRVWKQLNKKRIQAYKDKMKAQEEYNEHIFRMKVLHDKLFCNNGKEISKLLTKKDISDINKANINITRFNYIDYKVADKPTSELASDIHKYLEQEEEKQKRIA